MQKISEIQKKIQEEGSRNPSFLSGVATTVKRALTKPDQERVLALDRVFRPHAGLKADEPPPWVLPEEEEEEDS